MSQSAGATLALSKVGVSFSLHSYDYDPGAERIVLQSADAIASNRDAC
jgi:Cys-tRNA(Pro)/Cys-tRNA(Cys) deacylase